MAKTLARTPQKSQKSKTGKPSGRKAVTKSTAKRVSAIKAKPKAAAKGPAKQPAKQRAKQPVPFVSTGYWLLKSEPETYPIEIFAQDEKTLWTGVRNYQARNFMMTSMRPGDLFLFYHSNSEPSAVTGVGEIVCTNQPDPTAQDPSSEYHDPKASFDHPIWFCAEVSYKGTLKKMVTLQDIRERAELAGMALLAKGQRLSIQPVSKEHFELVVEMGGGFA